MLVVVRLRRNLFHLSVFLSVFILVQWFMPIHSRGIGGDRPRLPVRCLLGLARRDYLSAGLKHMSVPNFSISEMLVPTFAAGGQRVAHLEGVAPKGLYDVVLGRSVSGLRLLLPITSECGDVVADSSEEDASRRNDSRTMQLR